MPHSQPLFSPFMSALCSVSRPSWVSMLSWAKGLATVIFFWFGHKLLLCSLGWSNKQKQTKKPYFFNTVCGGQRTTLGVSSLHRVCLGIEFRSSALVARAFTCWVIPLVHQVGLELRDLSDSLASVSQRAGPTALQVWSTTPSSVNLTE